jgi:hypothetical protein
VAETFDQPFEVLFRGLFTGTYVPPETLKIHNELLHTVLLPSDYLIKGYPILNLGGIALADYDIGALCDVW